MDIHGLNKTTLLDYPGQIAATIFIGGCNFRCPFCHNIDLVRNPQNIPLIKEEELFEYLNKRKNLLGGICITGGEPTLAHGLTELIEKIKNMNYLVKLDTNGTAPEILENLVNKKLIDYIAMDIKTSLSNYSMVSGVNDISIDKIRKSIDFLKSGKVQYEFRTTVVKGLHKKEDFFEISKLLEGSDKYFLQAYRNSDHILPPELEAFSREEMELFAEIVRPYVGEVSIRGMD